MAGLIFEPIPMALPVDALLACASLCYCAAAHGNCCRPNIAHREAAWRRSALRLPPPHLFPNL